MPLLSTAWALGSALLLGLALDAGRTPDPQPSPDLAPEDVVRLQVEALGRNDAPHADAGIAAAFRFASPGNRAATGPLERFAQMVRGPVYRDMLDHARAEYGPIRVEGDRAAQRVTLVHADGRRATYTFGLSRQRGGAYDGCWMTDSVVREAAPPTNGQLRRV